MRANVFSLSKRIIVMRFESLPHERSSKLNTHISYKYSYFPFNFMHPANILL